MCLGKGGGDWIRCTDEQVAEVKKKTGVELTYPPYYISQSDQAGHYCGHMHRTAIEAWHCGTFRVGYRFTVRYFESWPTKSGDNGVEVLDSEIFSEDDGIF